MRQLRLELLGDSMPVISQRIVGDRLFAGMKSPVDGQFYHNFIHVKVSYAPNPRETEHKAQDHVKPKPVKPAQPSKRRISFIFFVNTSRPFPPSRRSSQARRHRCPSCSRSGTRRAPSTGLMRRVANPDPNTKPDPNPAPRPNLNPHPNSSPDSHPHPHPALLPAPAPAPGSDPDHGSDPLPQHPRFRLRNRFRPCLQFPCSPPPLPCPPCVTLPFVRSRWMRRTRRHGLALLTTAPIAGWRAPPRTPFQTLLVLACDAR